MTLLVGSIFHVTRKIVSEMTHNVSMGTLNPTIPYHLLEIQDMGVIRELEIYDRPKILNCNLYFVTTRDVSQQMSI